jgi:hypothetical protein
MRKRVIPFVLACGMACVSLTQAADPNLMGLWTLDDGTGTTAVDSTHKSGDATFTGSPTWSKEGQVGGCLVFNGTSDYCTVSGSWQFAQYTLATWFRIDSGSGTQRDLLSWCTANQEHGVLVEIGTNETMRFLHRAPLATTGGVSIYSTQGYTDRTWHHLAVAKSSTAMTLFIDGVQATTGADSSAFNAPVTRLFMGVLDARAMRFLPGALDDVRIYNRALTQDELPAVMKGVENAGVAAGASPKAGATDVPRDAVLGWKAGQFAKTHDVYFGTVLADVNNASRTAPAGVLASQGQDANSFDPAGLLAFGQTYYWRVDEVNAAPDSTIFEGATWSFTAETYGYPVTPVKATASSSLTSSMGPDKTIDGSGLDALGQHGTSSTQMWMSKKVTSGTPIWIQYEFDKVYKLYQMWVWNSNQAVEAVTGFGAKTVTIETSLDGTTWTALANVPEFAQASGEPNYVHNTTVDFAGTQAKFVKLTITSNWADSNRQASLSEVRFFYVPVKAFSPTPAVGATDVALNAVLNWRPGREAAKHDVTISTDAAAVTAGTAPVYSVTEHNFGLAAAGLEYATNYTWKVNEVNDAATPKSWEGDLWSFSTPGYGIVDDFESYDDTCNRIFFAWVDGFGHNGSTACGVAPSLGNNSGSMVGNSNPPFAERTVVHSGRQAMPMAYDNSGKGFAEATRTFQSSQDWTLGGAKTLVLYFRGDAANSAGQIYVKINDKQVNYNGGSAALTTGIWKQWNIDLASVGTNLKAIKSLTVGISGSGKGIVYVDDIRLYRIAPLVPVPADPGTNGLTAWYKMEADVTDSSGKGNSGTAEGNPVYVDGPAGYGKALQFDGLDDDVVLPVGTLISTMTSCSIATWVNLNTTNTGSWERVFDFGTSSTAGYMFLSPRQNTNGAMRFAITTGTNTGESGVNSPTNLSAGWHHVAVVIDGTAKTLQLCLDGEIVASGPTAVLPKDLGKTTQNWLGRSQWTSDAYFAGILDDFRIYTRPLSAGEVRYLAGDR